MLPTKWLYIGIIPTYPIGLTSYSRGFTSCPFCLAGAIRTSGRRLSYFKALEQETGLEPATLSARNNDASALPIELLLHTRLRQWHRAQCSSIISLTESFILGSTPSYIASVPFVLISDPTLAVRLCYWISYLYQLHTGTSNIHNFHNELNNGFEPLPYPILTDCSTVLS